MEKIRWGIIGCGNVTEVKSGPAFNKVPNSELIAVMRRDAAKAADYARRHSVPKWYSDAKQLINDPEVNAVYVATPPSTHEQYAVECIKAGKPVYLEKPMSLDANSAERIVNFARERSIKLSVAHYRRRLPIFLRIRELLQQEALGEVRFVQLRYCQPYDTPGFAPSPQNWRLQPHISGGGIFHDLAPHQLDLMYFFFGMPKQVTGFSFNQANHYDADDIVVAGIRFDSAVAFSGLWSFSAPPSAASDQCVITGSKGRMRFSIFNMERLQIPIDGSHEEIEFGPHEHVQAPMIKDVVRYFRGESTNPCSGEEALVVMKMIDTITFGNSSANHVL